MRLIGSSTSYATRRGSITNRIGSMCWRSRSGGSLRFSPPRNPISPAARSSSPACAGRSARSAVRRGREGASRKGKSPSASAVNEPQNDQENNRTDGGRDDGRNDAGAEVDAQLGQHSGRCQTNKSQEIKELRKSVPLQCPHNVPTRGRGPLVGAGAVERPGGPPRGAATPPRRGRGSPGNASGPGASGDPAEAAL